MKKPMIACLIVAILIIGGIACSPGSEDTSEELSATIEAASGGSLTSQDGLLSLEIPPGALAEDTEISVRPVSAEDLPDELAELAGGRGGYLLEPEGLTFQEPVALSWAVDMEDLTVEGEGGFAAQALVTWSEESGLEPLDDLVTEISLAEGTATLQGTLDHFSHITREDGALLVEMEDVRELQPVGNSFTAEVTIALAVRMHGVILIDIGGTTIASGQVELGGSSEFEADDVGIYREYAEADRTYRCKSQPGSGTYGVTVHALVTWEAGRSSSDRVLQVTITDYVDCVAGIEPVVPSEFTRGVGFSTMLTEMGFNADQVSWIEQARRVEDREDWLYSISQLPPGLREAYLDLLWLHGLITDAEVEQVREWFNDSLFPCGELIDGRLTVCSVTAGDVPAGDLLIFAAAFDGDIPLDDPDHHYVFAVVMDGDGDPSNNFEYMMPYDWDYYQGTDQWYELGWNPDLGQWMLTLRIVRGSQMTERHTDARAVIAGDLVVFFIPASEVDVEMPSFRMTSFGHDGTYAPEVSGGDVSGADPTEPLIPLETRLD